MYSITLWHNNNSQQPQRRIRQQTSIDLLSSTAYGRGSYEQVASTVFVIVLAISDDNFIGGKSCTVPHINAIWLWRTFYYHLPHVFGPATYPGGMKSWSAETVYSRRVCVHDVSQHCIHRSRWLRARRMLSFPLPLQLPEYCF